MNGTNRRPPYIFLMNKYTSKEKYSRKFMSKTSNNSNKMYFNLMEYVIKLKEKHFPKIDIGGLKVCVK
jgi:hypothetical protein